MDALPSDRRDDNIVNRQPAFIDRANGVSKAESTTFSLPTELMTNIFQLCGSDTRPRITFSHTCRRWRQIAVNHAPLWTSIFIQTRLRSPKARLDNFLSFLGMQLDRAGNRLLDVTWIAEIGDEIFNAALQLFREKARLSRWRTLRLEMYGGIYDEPHWSPADAFTNLESLHVLSCDENAFLDLIDRTITSRFKILNLRTWDADVVTTFPKSLKHISSLVLKHPPDAEDMAFLPNNVVKLQLDSADTHPFPHVQTYELTECTFTGSNSINLRSMTTLTVRGDLRINGPVFLPTLRDLTLGTLTIYSKAQIEAPALDTLYFTDNNARNVHSGWTGRSFSGSGYLLSPNTSIITDPHMPNAALIALLAKSSKVTGATLRFNDWAGAEVVLEKLAVFKTQTGSPSKDMELCPMLSALTLDFRWAFSDSSTSKKWILDRLKARGEAGIMPSIRACWKGEGTYVHLACD